MQYFLLNVFLTYSKTIQPILKKVSDIVLEISEIFREYSLNHVRKYTKCYMPMSNPLRMPTWSNYFTKRGV